MKENSKIYRCYCGYGDNMVIKNITVPEGLEFYINRHDRDDSSIDKDRYDLLAVIPYSKEKMDIISGNNLIANTCENIFDKYIIWQIRDIIPIDSDFPITFTVPVIDEIYFKMTKMNNRIMEMMHKERLLDCSNAPEQDGTIQNTINDEVNDVIYYAKIHGITENGYIDVTYNHVKNAWNGEDIAMITRESIEIRNIVTKGLLSNYSLIDEQEFDYALNESLLRLGVMF